jgi:hypothetical protein
LKAPWHTVGLISNQGEKAMPVNPNQTLDELAATFAELRAVSCRSYPAEVWKKAISLTNQIPAVQVCQALSVQPAYFRKKMKDFGATFEERPDFVQIKTKNTISTDSVTIELETPTGFKAKIQGSTFCLCQVLNGLFGGTL